LTNKISPANYNNVKLDLEDALKQRQEEKTKIKEIEQAHGHDSRSSKHKPINTPVLASTDQTAFHEAILHDFEDSKRLNIIRDQ